MSDGAADKEAREPDPEALKAELAQFRSERDKIRKILGQVGGAKSAKREKILTRVFIAALALLFSLDVLRHLLHVEVPLPPLFSIEIGVLLVSLKIIWMMQRQAKVEHFQFWILNSIEFRLNEISRRVKGVERELTHPAPAATEAKGDA